jgi:hypothetical protein
MLYWNLTPDHKLIDGHRGGGGVGKWEGKHWTPQASFKRLVNKNAIKPKIGRPAQAIFSETP